MRLAGKVALITGSDSGIGQASAIEMAKEGANIIVHYLEDKQGAEATRNQVEEAGQQAITVQADLSREEDIEKLFNKTFETFSEVHILMNNAGIDSAGTEVAEMSTERWDKAIKTNLYGYFWCCRRFIQHRKQRGGNGKIINVSSIHQDVPRKGAADYDCAKGAVRMLTRTLALELAAMSISANNIAPGMVLTPFNQKAKDDPKVRAQQVKNIPMQRAAQPEELGRLAVFLASSDSDYVTGTTFTMDGGLRWAYGQGAKEFNVSFSLE
jgi:glucose 1-dehydrogenase